MGFLLLMVAAVAIYLPLFSIRPLAGDNLYVLGWADSAPLEALWTVDPQLYPEWRPLPYFTIWLEHAVFGLDWVAGHFVVNLVLWVACCFLVGKIVITLTGDRMAALLAAGLLLVDRRAMAALSWIVERQTSMACGFGLLTLWLLLDASRSISRKRAVAIAAALIAAALSKEYGLAFLPAVFLWSIWTHNKRLAAIPVASGCAYLLLRACTAGLGTHGYCEDMGYLESVQQTCFAEGWSVRVAAQAAYNVAASFIGTTLPGLIDDNGAVYQDRWRLLRSVGLLELALVGWYAGARPIRAIAILALSNAVLGVMLYRDRNLLIGASAVAIAIGAGVALLSRVVLAGDVRRRLHAAVVVFLAAVLTVRTAEAIARSQIVAQHSRIDPCGESEDFDLSTAAYAHVLRRHYGLPACVSAGGDCLPGEACGAASDSP